MKKTLIYAGIGLSIAIINFYSFIWGINEILYRSGSSYWRSHSNDATVVLMIIVNSIFLWGIGKIVKVFFSLNISSIIPILVSIIFNALFCLSIWSEDAFGAWGCFKYLLIVSLATFVLESIKILVKRNTKQKNE